MHIQSRIKPEQTLHIIIRKSDIHDMRLNHVDDNEYLQLATMRLPAGKTFTPHYHLYIDTPRNYRIAQESWVVVQGNVEVTYYDLDNKEIHKDILTPGDCSVTLYGGHNYRAMDEAIVYEFKTGPYEGVEMDKKHIE